MIVDGMNGLAFRSGTLVASAVWSIHDIMVVSRISEGSLWVVFDIH